MFSTREHGENELFERYVEEKLKLYLSYGNAGNDLSRDNQVIDGSLPIFKNKAGEIGYIPRNFSDLLTWAACLTKWHDNKMKVKLVGLHK